MTRLSSVFLLFFWFLAVQGASKPNIVVFFADDLGYGDTGLYGHPTITTPNLDQLAAEGMKFTQWYSGAPICSASRSALLTGRLPVRNGVYTESDYPVDLVFRVFYPTSTGSLPATELTIPQLLKKAGYTSALIGKWHLGHYNNSLPIHRGFDYFYGLPYSQDEGCPTRYASREWCDHTWQEIWPGVPLYQNDTIIQQPVDLSTLVSRYNNEAINFISQNRNGPFYLEVAYDEVHVPLFASENFLNTSRRGLFGDALQEMDASIGLIVSYLKKLGLDQNTLILFTSDNGPWLEQDLNGGSAGLFFGGKGSTWEGGIREPAVARWPGVIAPGTVSLEVASTMDIFATALDIAGVPLPSDRFIDGKSLMPVFKGGSTQHDVLFIYREHSLMAVRYGPYKAHFITRSGFGVEPPEYHNPPLMFQIENDPSEKFPLNATDYESILTAINQAVSVHKASLIPGPPQLNPQDPFAMPCCHILTECTCN